MRLHPLLLHLFYVGDRNHCFPICNTRRTHLQASPLLPFPQPNMNRRKKGGNSSVKPPALSKPGAPSSSTPAPPSAMPARVSPPPKTPAPQQNVAPPQKAVPQPARTAAQAPRPTASPPKPPAPGMSAMKTAAPAARPGPSQRREITRSDRVRAQWFDFEVSWVRQRQAEVEQQLTVLLKAAEKNSRVKGRALEQNQDRIVNTVRREFAMAARAEWEARLEKAGLQAEDWTDMTPEEMSEVEQVLSCEDEDADPGVYALAQQRASAASTLSGKTAVESSPPPPLLQSASGRTAQAPPPAAAQKTSSAGPQAQAQSSSWIGWAASAFTRGGVSVKDVPEESSGPVCPSRSGTEAKCNAHSINRNPARPGLQRTPRSLKTSARRLRRPRRHRRLPRRAQRSLLRKLSHHLLLPMDCLLTRSPSLSPWQH